jgi:glycosyltransferase involved in cell wall biosynthesis
MLQIEPMKIACFCPLNTMAYIPCVYNLVNMFASDGHKVDVFTVAHERTLLRFNDERISVFLLKPKLQRGLVKWVPNLISYLFWVRLSARSKYDVCVGVDPPGLVAAFFLAKSLGIPFLIYESLELILSYDNKRMYPGYKWLERMIIPHAEMCITQDKVRAKLLSDDNNIPLQKVLTFPNSLFGSSRVKPANYLKSKFNLKKDDRIILYAGSVGDWVWSSQLVQASRAWPGEYKLIFHVRGGRDRIKMLYEGSVPCNVFISDGNIPNDQLNDVIDSCDIGLLFYDHPSPNIRYTGYASGKLCHYLYCGKPVICNDLPLISEELNRYRSGITVNEPNKILMAINCIISDYQSFQDGAQRHFDAELNLDNHFKYIANYLCEHLR